MLYGPDDRPLAHTETVFIRLADEMREVYAERLRAAYPERPAMALLGGGTLYGPDNELLPMSKPITWDGTGKWR